MTFSEEPQPMEWSPPSEPAPEPVAEAKSEETEDDINTDTLAELYISQAFYEKAIEIYERMLNERPGTAALEQKLEKLRALAAAADTGGTSIPASRAVAAEEQWAPPAEYQPPTLVGEEERSVEARPSLGEDASLKAMQEALEGADRPKPSATAPADAEVSRAPQTATARRKETIDRLETWLKNVMKEKPQ